jgi:hypothetical protein
VPQTFSGDRSWDNPGFRAYIAKIAAEVNAAEASRPKQDPEDIEKRRADLEAVAEAALEHLSIRIAPRARVARHLLRTLTRPGIRKVRDVGAYAAAAYKADPDEWRTIAIAAFDADGSYVDEEELTDAGGHHILSRSSARARGGEYDAYTMATWNPDGRYSYLKLLDDPDDLAA